MIRNYPMIQWVMARIRAGGGGIESWTGSGVPYPEVSGYIIPTLLNLDLSDIAEGLVEWLVERQKSDGGWPGLGDSTSQTFDTAAVVEGLRSYINFRDSQDEFRDSLDDVRDSLDSGVKFLRSMIRHDGTLARFVRDQERSPIYTARIAWILGESRTMVPWRIATPWPASWGRFNRSHYIAYLLEGLYNAGYQDDIMIPCRKVVDLTYHTGLVPWFIDAGWVTGGAGFDICATVQFAILCYKIGLYTAASRMMSHVNKYLTASGGLPQSPWDGREISWAVKYYLDWIVLTREVR